MHIDEKALADVRARYGEPTVLPWDGDVTAAEFALAGVDPERRHDVTFFVFNGPRLALIRKPQYAPEIWRPPGGGVRADEDFVAGVMREALEELGVDVELKEYLVASKGQFRFGGDTIDWRTHVFSATTDADELTPRDAKEIEAARWGTLDELAGPLRERLLATGGALWRYRVALHDAAIAAVTDRGR